MEKMKKEIKEKGVEKKGSISAGVVISFILAILAFVIILFVYAQFNWVSLTDKEICHQSVIYRATAPGVAGVNQLVPLKCNTEKKCVSGDKKEGCEVFEKSEKVDVVKVDSEDDIEKLVAECVVGSRIAFNKASLEKNEVDLVKVDVPKYMETTTVAGKDKTYFQLIGGEDYKIGDLWNIEENQRNAELELYLSRLREEGESVDKENYEIKNELEEKGISFEGLSEEEINKEIEELNKEYSGNELAVVFMQISAPTYDDIFWNDIEAAGTIFGVSVYERPGAFITTKTFKNPRMRGAAGRFVTGSGKIVAKGVLTPFSYIVGATAAAFGAYQMWNVGSNMALSAGYCGDMTMTQGDPREGCSVVRVVNYDKADLSSYCRVVESIP